MYCPLSQLSTNAPPVAAPAVLQINAWFIANRHPETGEYPDLPAGDAGGSKVILNPPLPTLEELLADEAAAGGKDSKGKGKAGSAKPAAKDGGKGGKDGKKAGKGGLWASIFFFSSISGVTVVTTKTSKANLGGLCLLMKLLVG